jgi:hypothetical protein
MHINMMFTIVYFQKDLKIKEPTKIVNSTTDSRTYNTFKMNDSSD